MPTTGELRQRAADCLDRARHATPVRAAQLRDCARHFRRQALRQQLFAHAQQVGRRHVTLASFRDHLRADRATAPTRSSASEGLAA